MKDWLKDEGVTLVDRISQPLPHAVEPEAMPLAPKKRNLGSLLKNARETGTPSQPLLTLEQVQGEIENYLRLPHVDKESNPLEWWKLNSGQFEPDIGKISYKVPCDLCY